MTDTSTVAALSRARWRIALTLTAVMIAVYVTFVLLVAYAKPLLGTVLVPGLSLGILLGVLVIAVTWVVIQVYVRWANRHYDAAVVRLRREAR
jgi:uncharacterized membrane protein (DUF485 family)